MTIDNPLLEPLDGLASLAGGTTVPLATVLAYSQAVSLKRIADYLGRMPSGAALGDGDPVINIGDAATGPGGRRYWSAEPAPGAEEVDDFDTEAETTPANAKVTPQKLLKALPEKAINLGFKPVKGATVVDPGSGSPVDRNAQVRVFYANGQMRTNFGGSVAWLAGEGDAWRPLGFMPFGDGANVSAEDRE